VREVGKACGWRSPNTAHSAITKAIEEGLIAWGEDHHRPGTLHPTVVVVAALPNRK